jgi:glycosyltransferase involved in cell wall biosynthesis
MNLQSSTPRPVHVLYFLDRLGPILGGGERVLLSVLHALPKDRFRVSLATFSCELDRPVMDHLPCPVHVFPMKRTYGVRALRMAMAFRKLLLDEHVDIVQTIFESADLWAGLVTKATSKAKLISSRRDLGILRSTKHRVAYRLLAGLPDRVLAVSDQVRRFCIEADGLPPERVFTLYNGIAVDAATEAERNRVRQELQIPPGAAVITTVGNLRRVKGADVLIRAAVKVRNRFPEALFLICGSALEPDYVSDLRDLIKQFRLEAQVRLLGGQEQVPSILALTTVFALPSHSEGFSNALIEAMAAGLPCVATNVGGNSEAITDGVDGILVPAANADALADAICHLLDHQTAAAEMGVKAKITYQERFTVEAMINALVHTYEEVLMDAAL